MTTATPGNARQHHPAAVAIAIAILAVSAWVGTGWLYLPAPPASSTPTISVTAPTADGRYIQILDAYGVPYASQEGALTVGRMMADMYNAGYSATQVEAQWMQVNQQLPNPYTRAQVQRIVAAAVAAYSTRG